MSNMLHAYLKKYQDDPTSRVFAPLSEAYRRAGLYGEAIEIAREGLKIHPDFAGGRVALARALFDKKSYSEVIEETRKVVQVAPDNLSALRLLAEASLVTGNIPSALEAFKLLLYYLPGDEEIARMVGELETQAYEGGAVLIQTEALEDRSEDWANKIEFLTGLLQNIERYRNDLNVRGFR